MKDSEFVNWCGAVLGTLVGLAVLIFVVANMISGTQQSAGDFESRHAAQRIEPVGKVHIGEVATYQAEESMPATESLTEQSPEDLYKSSCATCHATGLLKAPKYGKQEDWEGRLDNIDQLYLSAINGKGQMPAKGGRADLSDEATKSIVDYMLKSISSGL